MEIQPVAVFHGPLVSKFGIPRQSGVVEELEGTVELLGEYACEAALRGMEGFDRIWLIWGFSENRKREWQPTVRPPRLGGNKSLGVFATRSPYRPNPIGLSAVEITGIEGTMIHVRGADLMDGTPIYDIKPYVAYADAFPQAESGFVGQNAWKELDVVFPENLEGELEGICGKGSAATVSALLAQDPRPHYQDDPDKVYGMTYGKADVHFTVVEDRLTVTGIDKIG